MKTCHGQLRPLSQGGGAEMLHLLDTVYSVQDMWWLIEIQTVDNHNKSVAGASNGGINN